MKAIRVIKATLIALLALSAVINFIVFHQLYKVSEDKLDSAEENIQERESLDMTILNIIKISRIVREVELEKNCANSHPVVDNTGCITHPELLHSVEESVPVVSNSSNLEVYKPTRRILYGLPKVRYRDYEIYSAIQIKLPKTNDRNTGRTVVKNVGGATISLGYNIRGPT